MLIEYIISGLYYCLLNNTVIYSTHEMDRIYQDFLHKLLFDIGSCQKIYLAEMLQKGVKLSNTKSLYKGV